MNNVLIGVGNEYRHDDAAGLLVARRLRSRLSCVVREHSGEGASLMEYWKGAGKVIIADAVQSGAASGTIYRFDATKEKLSASAFRDSTHAVSLGEAIELARALDQLPKRLIVYGIEGRDFEAGIGLSLEVERAVREVVERIVEEFGEANASKRKSHR